MRGSASVAATDVRTSLTLNDSLIRYWSVHTVMFYNGFILFCYNNSSPWMADEPLSSSTIPTIVDGPSASSSLLVAPRELDISVQRPEIVCSLHPHHLDSYFNQQSLLKTIKSSFRPGQDFLKLKPVSDVGDHCLYLYPLLLIH